MVKTPSFWYPAPDVKKPLKAFMLSPLSWFYHLGFKIHYGVVDAKVVDVPIICVGNLNVGGTGKTPSCIALEKIFTERNITKAPYFLLRGYGGSERGPLLVNPETDLSKDVGDEALLLSRYAPTIIATDRVEGAKYAKELGADLVIMDDGFQNPSLEKDISLLVINGAIGFGNGCLLPAGPLREPLEEGLNKANGFLLIGDDAHDVRSILPSDKPVFGATLKAFEDNLPCRDKRYIAFTGLGYPQKFFNFLMHDCGYDIIETVGFSDHYDYQDRDIERLRALADKENAALITTEKDFVRLSPSQRDGVSTLPVFMQFSEEDALAAFIQGELS
ncbi:MAG: tetraacyldisaccharide 4'-kinase [Bdellovibrionales bacterium]